MANAKLYGFITQSIKIYRNYIICAAYKKPVGLPSGFFIFVKNNALSLHIFWRFVDFSSKWRKVLTFASKRCILYERKVNTEKEKYLKE